jgi:Leucine-rich repeat (LRR) protein
MEGILPLDVPNTLASLKELLIFISELQGTSTIPSALGLLTSLTKLDLSGNKLESGIPSELGLLSNLTSLILKDNLLSGAIPEEIGDLTSLVNIDVTGNREMQPFIPAGLCSTNHTGEWDSMTTDWCSGQLQCCTKIKNNI